MPGVLEALQRLPDLGDPYADERGAIQRLLALGEPPGERRASARQRGNARSGISKPYAPRIRACCPPRTC